ncbi:MAG: FKBP-type peptidyl-prolyl cis-trans isomerase [Chloroflexota bacterium]|nr:MAG: FKBP-type peptidyl-prolyl cis-trans isomerase [Chloroflexota bacterium]
MSGKNTFRSQRRAVRAAKRRNQRIIAGVVIFIIIAAIALFAYLTAVNRGESLVIEDLVVGEGTEVKQGDTISVHYTGWLEDGSEFDSNQDGDQPFEFTVGTGNVIPGWDKGLVGMRVGGKRKLTVGPSMAYGPNGYQGVIPPNATLTFEVELLEIK